MARLQVFSRRAHVFLVSERNARILTGLLAFAEGEPYYPILHPESQAMYKQYQWCSDTERAVWFVCRLVIFKHTSRVRILYKSARLA